MGTTSTHRPESTSLKEILPAFFDEQLAVWETARNNYAALSQVREKVFEIDGFTYKVQFNPARITSSTAKIDAASIQQRPCFLCDFNRPAEQQEIPLLGHYHLLVNPYPIFPRHLTLPDQQHTPQCIESRMGDMLKLARLLDEYVIFYNGSQAGASAPDHLHFQAGNKGFLPIEKEWKRKSEDPNISVLVIEAAEENEALHCWIKIIDLLKYKLKFDESMLNIITFYEDNRWIICIFPREKHRPACYFAEGDKKMLISPGAVDLGGVFTLPREEDFEKVTPDDIRSILQEVSLSPNKWNLFNQTIRNKR
ncbi:MAG: DUF4922 domain-containing protein [Bacteroides sp.]|nr:DUF4922 domain-containing protein [Bacteroides sp.]